MTDLAPDVDDHPIRIEVSLKSPRALAEVAAASGVALEELVDLCKEVIDRHWLSFGTKALTLEYSSRDGYLLRATSGVGALVGRGLEILIQPKVPNLSLEKVLALAQHAGNERLKIGNDRLQAQIDTSIEYGALDLLGFSLSDAVFTIAANGLLKATREKLEISTGASSGPDLDANIERGFNPPLIVSTIQSDTDVPSNQLIKAALEKVRDSTSQQHLKDLLARDLSNFREVGPLPKDQPVSEFLSDFSGTPRPDYDRGISLASAILASGSFSVDGGADLAMPDVVIDMDETFEAFCSNVLHESFTEGIQVRLQPEFPHKATPPMPSKSIRPDILVTEADTGRKIVVDVKNKYTALDDFGQPEFSNSDLFQQYYYAKNLDAYCVILLFPSVNPSWRFPLRGSESQTSFDSKVQAALASPDLKVMTIEHSGAELDLYAVEVDLSGSLKNSVQSISRVAFLVNRLFQEASP